MAKESNPFGPGLLGFLNELRTHNERAWFKRNQERYEAEVRGPALDFIRLMAPRIEKISPHLVASDRKVGGSLMRIHRDVRFSKNKAPYKTNLGIQFRHEQGKDVHAPGLYFHVDPDSAFLGVGMWRPDGPSLAAVRKAIDEDPRGWRRASRGKRFTEVWEPGGESLKRAPLGYAADHPWIEDLRRKDHIAICSLTLPEITGSHLLETVMERFRRSKPYLGWLAEALDLPF